MPNFDAIRIGVIKKIKGEAIAIGRYGTTRVLHKGDEIYLGDDIKTSENSNLTIVLMTAKRLMSALVRYFTR